MLKRNDTHHPDWVTQPPRDSEKRGFGAWATFAQSIVAEFGVVVGWGIHEPRDISDQRNIVAFLLITTRALEEGVFGRKVREMSIPPTSLKILSAHRKQWADLQNTELLSAGVQDRVDHRSLREQRADAIAVGDMEMAEALSRSPQRKLDRA